MTNWILGLGIAIFFSFAVDVARKLDKLIELTREANGRQTYGLDAMHQLTKIAALLEDRNSN